MQLVIKKLDCRNKNIGQNCIPSVSSQNGLKGGVEGREEKS